MLKPKKLTLTDLVGKDDSIWEKIFSYELTNLSKTKLKGDSKRLNKRVRARVWFWQTLSPVEFLTKSKGETFGSKELLLYKNILNQIDVYLEKYTKRRRKRMKKATDAVWVYSPLTYEDLDYDTLFLTDDLLDLIFRDVCIPKVYEGQTEYFYSGAHTPILRVGSGHADVRGKELFMTPERKIVIMVFLNIFDVKIPYQLLNFYQGRVCPATIISDFGFKGQDVFKETRREGTLKNPNIYLQNA